MLAVPAELADGGRRLQWPASPAGVVVQGGGDAGVAGQPEDGDGQVGWP